MKTFLLSFFASFIATWLIIHYKHLHLQLSADSDFAGPQKFHNTNVPRIGGIAIAIGIFFSIALNFDSSQNIAVIFLICSIPAFAIGLLEDLTKKISISVRLLLILISAVLMAQHLNLEIYTLDIIFIDPILSIPLVGFCFTLFAITGLTNAYNIIDGFNGLSSMVGIITLIALSYVSYQFNDLLLMKLCITMIGAILGFLIWNYPSGLIFLGDSGAYLIGLWIASVTILITSRHPEISPWFALTINGYPVFETIFTIYRRKIHQGKSPGLPDGLHFHTLIYRRILSKKKNEQNILSANSRTAPYLWALSIISILPALIWYRSTIAQMCTVLIFGLIYIWTYSRIVKFKTAHWLRSFF
jgi:UDP-N-acetylmuramyl pentapeptide phosphotransferase/UDP-N-acetylglucosamine-1-phosphate transferase